jgi:hypothetical protein
MGPINGSLLDGQLKRGFVFRHTVRSEIGGRMLSGGLSNPARAREARI